MEAGAPSCCPLDRGSQQTRLGREAGGGTQSQTRRTQRREVEVTIVGNGPSSILLSLMLSGHWPYFTGSHPNPYLTAKLQQNPDKSILEQDLELLSEGLEGRSTNPVALLLDTLLRPNADTGERHAPSLRWELHPSRAVPHLVVGRGSPGGCWQDMDPEIRTLSLQQWLELPLYPFREWREERGQSPSGAATDSSGRVPCGEVARYYSDYVQKMGLSDNFLSDTDISEVCNLEKLHPPHCCRPSASPSLPACHSPSPLLVSPPSPCLAYADPTVGRVSWEHLTDLCSQLSDPDPDDSGVFCCQRRVSKCRWCTRGTTGRKRRCTNRQLPVSRTNGHSPPEEEEKLSIFSQKLVLACGVQGNCRRLGVAGEEQAAASFLSYDYPDFAHRIRCHAPHTAATTDSQPFTKLTVLVVGAGLSAADAVLLALERDAKVVHVFEKDPFDQQLIFSRMPESVYPRYKRVHRLMQGKKKGEEEESVNYVRCARCRITEFHERGFSVESLIASPSVEERQRWTDISLGVVLVGTEAKLSFLPESLTPKLGRLPDAPVTAKRNPVDVDPFTFVTEACPSLYAMGSLTGDNFVRFGVGSALGAAKHILQLDT